ncbi:damage-inducible protein DinB [Peribacillus simplex]|uniref:DinB family protein n=1 Tax=Peribacillus simplex TaxID=1478 RepID=UPI0010BF33D5|nr:DinB family protein [Peribacillus simplex]TKH05166.1 damage-inducible protein DinB [Peribacillus simplex]
MENNHRAKKMYDYHVWANQQVFQNLKQLPEGVYGDTIKSVFPSIQEVLVHLYATDITWLEIMKGSTIQETFKKVEQRRKEVDGVSINELESYYDELAKDYDNFLASQPDLERTIVTEHPKMGICEFVLADLIHHVVNHGTYHRGNVSAMLHQQGERGAPTDYVFYCLK